ncbi:MAG: hypothetical protein K2L61_02555, partial [Clostridia bacterium]|nr:hypothetical protein [Clostridia bacterium]
MEKFLTQVSENISSDVAKTIADVMPMGHICVCYLSGDKALAQKAIEEVSEFEYKITFVEYPDEVICNDESALDIVNCDDDVRLILGVGGREIANLLCRACEKRPLQYALVTDTPFLYGVGYALKGGYAPIKLLIDKDGKDGFGDYAKCVGAILAHRVSLWEKKYVHYMMGVQDYASLKAEQDLLDGIIGDGQMSDTARLFDGMLAYAKVYNSPYKSSAEVLAELIEHVNLTTDRGESLLLAGIALVKYFKSVMSIDEYSLIAPADVSSRCRALAKILGANVSDFIGMVKDRKFQSKWLYIHDEYRQDMLKEISELDAKLLNIIKSAKRFMPDVGYHLGEDYDCNSIIQLVYNLSPIVHECSPIAMA